MDDTVGLCSAVKVLGDMGCHESMRVRLIDKRRLKWYRPQGAVRFAVQITRGPVAKPGRPLRNVGNVLTVRVNQFPECDTETGRFSFVVHAFRGSGASCGEPGILLNAVVA